ncbi:hypothetical protein [Yeosuana sp. AK3]
MKRITLILILIVVIYSCGNDSKKADHSTFNTSQIEAQEEALLDSPEDLKELLTKTTPLKEAEFKEAFPKSIRNLPLDDEVEIINQQGYATYGNKKITLSIYDCVGKNYGKAALFGTVYNIKAQDIDDTKYSNITRDAIKTISTHRVNRNQSDITFLHKNRWYVVLTGNTMNPDELWSAFDLKALNNFTSI